MRLTRHTHQRLDDALDRLVMDRIETRTGVLREIDLDERTFLLRHGDDPAQIRCSFPNELYEAAKEAFDRPVRVSGVMRTPGGRRGATLLEVERFEVLDEALAPNAPAAVRAVGVDFPRDGQHRPCV